MPLRDRWEIALKENVCLNNLVLTILGAYHGVNNKVILYKIMQLLVSIYSKLKGYIEKIQSLVNLYSYIKGCYMKRHNGCESLLLNL